MTKVGPVSGDYLDHIREQYPLVRREWRAYVRQTRGDDEMAAGTTIVAPDNPYRDRYGATQMFGETPLMTSGPLGPLRADTRVGPGLSGADIDRIARDHHAAGYAMAERLMQQKLDEMQDRLAAVFDEGYTAGRVLRAQGLAKDVRHRLMSMHFALLAAEQAKTKVSDRLPAVRAEWDELERFVTSIEVSPPAAAAQVARDE